MKPGRNDPCPCGSGKKYKKCHLAEHEAAARPAPQQPLSVSSMAKHIVERFLPSDGVDDDVLAEAAEYFAERDAGRGPAQQMKDFAQPLIDEADGSTDALDKALSLATVFWNLAITPEQEQEQALAEIMAKMFEGESDDVRSAFQATAGVMIERHHQMFPEMHHR